MNLPIRYLVPLCLIGQLAFAGDAATTVEPPQAVQRYIDGLPAALGANTEVKEEAGLTLDLNYKLLFKRRSYDFRSGANSAWLLGYRTGFLRGKANTSLTMIELVDEGGVSIFKLPDPARDESILDSAFNEGLVVRIADNVFALGLSQPGERDSPGSAEIWKLGAQPQKWMVFEDANYPQGGIRETDVYFYDADSDDRRELLVEERTTNEQTSVVATARKIYKLEANNQTFSEFTSQYSGSLPELFETAKNNAQTPRISQVGPPR